LADRQVAQSLEDIKIKRAQAHDVSMAKLLDSLKTDGPDKNYVKEQMKGLGQAKEWINEVAANVPAFLEKAGGPDAVRTFIRRKIETLGLDPDTAAAAFAYYDKEVQDQIDGMPDAPLKRGGSF
jgi:hypothetical protein